MKIALITYLFPAKSETFIVEKAVRLAKSSENSVTLFTRQLAPLGYFSEKVRSAPNLRIVELYRSDWQFSRKLGYLITWCFRQPKNFLKTYKQYRSLTGISVRQFIHVFPVISNHPDLIHFEYLSLAELYLGLIRSTTWKKVVSCRGADLEILPAVEHQHNQAYREIFNLADRVHCLGPWLREIAVQKFDCDPQKIDLIPPSINPGLFKNKEQEIRKTDVTHPFLVGTVARLHWKKGHIYALQAIRELVNRGLDIKYQIVGDGEEKERLKFDIYDMGLSDRVQIMDWMKPEEVRDFLSQIDVFVLPSISEGFGNVVLEAMSMSKPVIVTNVGCANAITHGIEGLVVPRRDVKQLADAIQYLYDHSEECVQMGIAGRKAVETKYHIEMQIESFEKLYRSVLFEK